jgi:hypothetical protein
MIFFAVLLLRELFLALVQTNLISLTPTGTQPADYIISFFSFLYTYGPKPLHLIIISVVGTIFTSQNQFHSFRNMVSTVTVYTFVIGAWVILMVSFWFYISATGDIFFRQTIEELAIIIMLGTGIGHFFYLHMEFRPLLQARVNLYYLIGQGRGVRLSLLLFFGVISFVMLQGAIKWRSRTMLFHSYYSQKGDHYFLKEDYPRAATYYEYAVEGDIMNVNYNGTIVAIKLGGAGFSPKPNYNLATIYASENKINKALQY